MFLNFKFQKWGQMKNPKNPKNLISISCYFTVTALSQFIFGECLEVCARRGLLSGLNCTSAPIFLELNIATAPTYITFIYRNDRPRYCARH